MAEPCAGSLGRPRRYPLVPSTYLPTARCPVCGRFVEMHPIEPSGSPDVWRLEMHDSTGRTLRAEDDDHPAPDALTPESCPDCGSVHLSVRHAGEHLAATCADCGHDWLTGHANDLSRSSAL